MANTDKPLLIKRYASRRLYNTETSDYVTLEDIAGFIRAGREDQIIDLRPVTGADGISRCQIVLDHFVVPTQWQPRRAFQGWRYLAAAESPRDLPKGRAADDTLPPELARALAEIGLR